MRKKLIVISGVVVFAVVATVAIAVSLLINIDQFRPQLARAMSAALARDVAIGHISLSIFSASAAVEDLSIADDPAFGTSPFVTAKSVRVGIALLPLITSKHLRVLSLRLYEPRLTLRRSAAGTWNFSTLGGAASAAPPGSAAPLRSSLTFSIERLAIANGRVAIETAGSRISHVTYDDLTVDVRDVSATSPVHFAVSATLPAGGTLKSNGTAGPLSPAGLGSTPFDATIDAVHVDIAHAGIVDPSSGLGGVVDLHLRIGSTGVRISSAADVRVGRLQLIPGAATASQPVEIAFASDYNLSTHDGTVNRGDVRIGSAAAHLTGRFSTRTSPPVVQLTVAGHQMPVTDLQSILPAIGVALPRGTRFQSGVLDTDLAVRGPLDRLVIAGPVAMAGARLSGFDLGSRMQTIASLAGYSGKGDTSIESLHVTLRVAPDGIRADGLTCIMPDIGQLQGAGTIAPSGALDFRMRAALKHATGAAGQIVKLVSFGHPENGVPFRIAGTTSSPVFIPDVTRAAADTIKSPGTIAKAAGFMQSLFRRSR